MESIIGEIDSGNEAIAFQRFLTTTQNTRTKVYEYAMKNDKMEFIRLLDVIRDTGKGYHYNSPDFLQSDVSDEERNTVVEFFNEAFKVNATEICGYIVNDKLSRRNIILSLDDLNLGDVNEKNAPIVGTLLTNKLLLPNLPAFLDSLTLSKRKNILAAILKSISHFFFKKQQADTIFERHVELENTISTMNPKSAEYKKAKDKFREYTSYMGVLIDAIGFKTEYIQRASLSTHKRLLSSEDRDVYSRSYTNAIGGSPYPLEIIKYAHKCSFYDFSMVGDDIMNSLIGLTNKDAVFSRNKSTIEYMIKNKLCSIENLLDTLQDPDNRLRMFGISKFIIKAIYGKDVNIKGIDDLPNVIKLLESDRAAIATGAGVLDDVRVKVPARRNSNDTILSTDSDYSYVPIPSELVGKILSFSTRRF
jgi:hypothetical protein